MKTVFLSFLFILLIGNINLFSQINKVVFIDKSELTNKTSISILSQKLAAEHVILEDEIDYGKQCEYLYVKTVFEEDRYNLVAKDCHNQILSTTSFSSVIDYAGDESIGNELANAIIKVIQSPVLDSAVSGDKAIYTNHHDSRYFFAPSAYNLKKGQLYYNTIYGLVHDLQYGITDNFSLGGGTTIIGLPAYITPKVSIPISDNMSIMAGDLLIFGTWGVDFSANIAYGGITFGNKTNNLTVAGGALTSSISKNANALLNFSAMFSTSKYISFVTENYITNFDQSGSYDEVVGQETYTDYYGDTYIDDIYENRTFPIKTRLLAGFSGVRFTSKKSDVQAVQVGFAYAINLMDKFDKRYEQKEFYKDFNFNRVVIPTISYTLKFGKVY